MGKKKKFRDDASEYLIRLNDIIHKMLPIILIVLTAYLVIYFFTSYSHPLLHWVERIVLGYFVLELLVLFSLYKNKKKFFKDKWFYIILIIPVFATVRAIGRTAHLARVGAVAEGARTAQFVELINSSRIIRGLSIFSRLQKPLHLVADIPKVMKMKAYKTKLGGLGITSYIATQNMNKEEEDDETEKEEKDEREEVEEE